MSKRKYELVSVFRVTGDAYLAGQKAVKDILTQANSDIESEVDMENRPLAYPIQKETRGHYRLFNIVAEPQQIVDLDEKLRLVKELLRFLFVQK